MLPRVLDAPFGSAKPEAVGELALQRVPVLLLLLVRQLEYGVVELLELLVLLHDRRIAAPFGRGLGTASAAAASTSVLALNKRDSRSVSANWHVGGQMRRSPFRSFFCPLSRVIWDFSRSRDAMENFWTAAAKRKRQWEVAAVAPQWLAPALAWTLSTSLRQEGSIYPRGTAYQGEMEIKQRLMAIGKMVHIT